MAQRSASFTTWGSLGFLCAQWGLMARLTYYEYSWDVMEPISYFLGAGTGILGLMFYLATRKDYSYETLHGITYTKKLWKVYNANKFQVEKYHSLLKRKEEIQGEIDTVKKMYGTV